MAMDARKQRILEAIVALYANDGEPVGSGLLSGRKTDLIVFYHGRPPVSIPAAAEQRETFLCMAAASMLPRVRRPSCRHSAV